MSRQLLIYERVAPVSFDRHGQWSVKESARFNFARNINSVPLLATEFIAASADYPIVFAGDNNTVFPSALLGLEADKNVFLGSEGEWIGGYVPAFLRRYPFVFSESDDAKTFTLCIDEEYEGLNQEGRGERLFDNDGERTQYLQSKLDFVVQFQGQHARTVTFCRRLLELGVLEPGEARMTRGDGQPLALGGFMIVNRDRLKAIPEDAIKTMFQTDELELCFLHLQSLRNIENLSRRLSDSSDGGDAGHPLVTEATQTPEMVEDVD